MKVVGLRERRIDGLLPLAAALVTIFVVGPFVAWAIVEQESLLLLMLGVAALGLAALRWPVAIAMGAYAFFLPLDAVSFAASLRVATITKLIGVLAAAVLLTVGLIEKRLVRPPLVALWVGALAVWAMLTLGWAVNLEAAQVRVTTVASLAALYLVALSFRVSAGELRAVCLLAMLGGTVAATAGVVLGFDTQGDPALRGTLSVAGQHVNPNAVAETLLVPLAMAVALFVASRHVWSAGFAIFVIAGTSAGIFLTMSRSSLGALIIMMAVFLYRLRARTHALVVIGVLVAVLPFMPAMFFERITNVFTGADSTGAGRTNIWEVGLLAIDRFGWFGAGLSNFPHAYDIFAPGGFSKGAHNTFLGTWVELGIVGLALLLAVFAGHLRVIGSRRFVRSDAFHIAIQAGCVAMMVIAFFSDILWSKFLWMSWILAAWASQERQEPSSRTASLPHRSSAAVTPGA